MAAIGLIASAFSEDVAGLAAKLEQVLVTVRTRAGGGSGTARSWRHGWLRGTQSTTLRC